jgi:hypothetical protein
VRAAIDQRWALDGARSFPPDYVALVQSFLSRTPSLKLYVMVPPPLYRDGR